MGRGIALLSVILTLAKKMAAFEQAEHLRFYRQPTHTIHTRKIKTYPDQSRSTRVWQVMGMQEKKTV